jgi:hypothetical protein
MDNLQQTSPPRYAGATPSMPPSRRHAARRSATAWRSWKGLRQFLTDLQHRAIDLRSYFQILRIEEDATVLKENDERLADVSICRYGGNGHAGANPPDRHTGTRQPLPGASALAPT